MSKNGLILLTPTSIAYTGTSATVSANGSVSFSAVSSLSLNGVFSADYDNYMMVMWSRFSVAGGEFLDFRLRASGTDNTTASSYVTQRLDVDNTSVGGARTTSDKGYIGYIRGTAGGLIGGEVAEIYGPFLAQPTAWRNNDVSPLNNAFIRDCSGTHNQSASYDGATFSVLSGNITGLISIYGLVGA